MKIKKASCALRRSMAPSQVADTTGACCLPEAQMMMDKQKRDKGELDGPKSRITALCSMVAWHCDWQGSLTQKQITRELGTTQRWLWHSWVLVCWLSCQVYEHKKRIRWHLSWWQELYNGCGPNIFISKSDGFMLKITNMFAPFKDLYQRKDPRKTRGECYA